MIYTFYLYKNLKVSQSWDPKVFLDLSWALAEHYMHIVHEVFSRPLWTFHSSVVLFKLLVCFTQLLSTNSDNDDINQLSLHFSKRPPRKKSVHVAKLWVRSNLDSLESCNFLEPNNKWNNDNYLGMGLKLSLTAFCPLQGLPAIYFFSWLQTVGLKGHWGSGDRGMGIRQVKMSQACCFYQVSALLLGKILLIFLQDFA